MSTAGCNIAIKNLPHDMGKESLRPLFKKFGKINLLHVANGTAAIEFQKPVSATSSVTSMNNAVIGGQRIFVSLTSDAVPSVKRGTVPAAPTSSSKPAKPTKKAVAPTPAAPTPVPTEAAAADDADRSFTKLCYHFRKGRCSKGDTCTYLHTSKLCPTVEYGGVCTRMDMCKYSHDPNNALVSGLKSADATKSQTLCQRIALGGHCTYGDRCRHDPTTALKGKSNVLCKNFAAGCRKGDKCWFSHDPTTAVAAPAKRPATDDVQPAPVAAPSAKKAKTTTTNEVPKKEQPQKAEVAALTCGECTKAAAAITCAQCDEGLCAACDTALHASRIMSKHVRTAVPKVEAVVAQCGECRGAAATVHCVQCDVDYCGKCSWSVHEFKVFRTHRREALLKVRTTPTAPSLVPVTQQVQGVAKAAAAVPVTQPKPTTTVHNIRAYPKTELSSDDSSDDDEEDDNQPPAKVQKTLAAPPVVAKKKAAAIAPSQPKMALSSDSSDEGSDVEVNQPPPVVKAAPLGVKKAPAVDLSSEDESDFSDEKPIILPAKKSAAALSSSDDSSDEDEGQVRVKPAPVKAVAPQTADSSDEDSSDEEGGTHVNVVAKAAAVPTADSAHSLVKKIEAYAASTNVDVLHLSPSLNSYERLLAHDCAERLGLSHESVGQGLDRHITVGRGGATKKKSWSKTRA
ncbi:hypothetical protein DYB36_001247 [Aphanomyces astaci]|uniref:Uncharacterized protein n=3 Tax=Aphanomyces astaci TaxID=112090 RepID=A0A397B2T5_APHAT|nr:hypothetical protein DYB36_001247 [Aphanomyces astaci]